LRVAREFVCLLLRVPLVLSAAPLPLLDDLTTLAEEGNTWEADL
jgi:hypothetical protein